MAEEIVLDAEKIAKITQTNVSADADQTMFQTDKINLVKTGEKNVVFAILATLLRGIKILKGSHFLTAIHTKKHLILSFFYIYFFGKNV